MAEKKQTELENNEAIRNEAESEETQVLEKFEERLENTEAVESYKSETKRLKIIEKYTITDQLNIMRRAIMELSNDEDLHAMGNYIDEVLSETPPIREVEIPEEEIPEETEEENIDESENDNEDSETSPEEEQPLQEELPE